MKQIRFPYGDKLTQIVETPDDDLSEERASLTSINKLLKLGCKVSIINNDTQQVIAEWIPDEHQVIDADKVELSDPNLLWLKVRKKPVVVHALQMDSAFETTTLEGRIKGKAGDYLMVGIHGERYPIDKEIFEKTYDVLPAETAIQHFVKTTSSEPPTDKDILDELNREVAPSFRDAVAKAMSQPRIKIERGDNFNWKKPGEF